MPRRSLAVPVVLGLGVLIAAVSLGSSPSTGTLVVSPVDRIASRPSQAGAISSPSAPRPSDMAVLGELVSRAGQRGTDLHALSDQLVEATGERSRAMRERAAILSEAFRRIAEETRNVPEGMTGSPGEDALRAIQGVEAAMARHLPDPRWILADVAVIPPVQVLTPPEAPPQVPPTVPVPQAPTAGDIVPGPIAPMSGGIIGAPPATPQPGTPVEGNVRVRPLP